MSIKKEEEKTFHMMCWYMPVKYFVLCSAPSPLPIQILLLLVCSEILTAFTLLSSCVLSLHFQPYVNGFSTTETVQSRYFHQPVGLLEGS